MGKIAVSYPSVYEGCDGEIVTQLQFFLSKFGSNLSIDGHFGLGTRNAVRAFQKKNGLEITGRVENSTWMKLLEVAGNIKSSESKKTKRYTLKIPDLTEAEMNELLKKYPKAEKV